MELRDRFLGSMLGLACGDALGTTAEFKPRGSFAPITDMVGGGPFNLEPGQWTDDTSMAMGLARSLIDHGFNPQEQMEAYVRWWKEGEHSSTGRCFDIGSTVRGSLARFRETGDPMAGLPSPDQAGNGCLMRLAPVPLYYVNDPFDGAVTKSGVQAATTHGATEAIDACRWAGALIVGACYGAHADDLLGTADYGSRDFWSRALPPLCPAVEAIANGSFKSKGERQIQSSGYVIHSLEAALWAFARTDTFEAGALLAVNLGGDADTIGAIYGQIAGAYYGVGGIPPRWLATLAHREVIEDYAGRLYAAAMRVPRPAAAC